MKRMLIGVMVVLIGLFFLGAAGKGDKDGHDHGDAHTGKRQDLGSKEVAGYTIKVQQESVVHAGEEAAFAITVTVTGGTAKPKAVRAWVGIESAEGSAKCKAVAEGEELHAHVEVPKPLPAKSQFWVELETASGKSKVAFDHK